MEFKIDLDELRKKMIEARKKVIEAVLNPRKKARNYKSLQEDKGLPEKPKTGSFIEEYGKLGK